MASGCSRVGRPRRRVHRPGSCLIAAAADMADSRHAARATPGARPPGGERRQGRERVNRIAHRPPCTTLDAAGRPAVGSAAHVPPRQYDSERPGPTEPDSERDRLIWAFSRSLAELGYKALTPAAVARTAGVPEASFEAHFATKERGLVAAQEVFLDRLWLEVIGACQLPTEWPGKVSAGLGSALDALTEASALARVFTVEATGVSLAAAERHFAALDQFASLLREGRNHYPRASSLPELAERTLIGGVASIAAAALLAEEPAALSLLRPQLTEMLLAPYLGEEEARRVAGCAGV